MTVGLQPTVALTESEALNQGLGFKAGAKATDSKGHEYVCVRLAASQNVVAGHVVYLDNSYVATILASASPAPGVSGYQLAVAVCANTASVSMFMWAQVYGSCGLLTSDITASNLPGHVLVPTSVPGAVKGAIATASSYISGLVFTVTASSVNTVLAGFANYPRMAPA